MRQSPPSGTLLRVKDIGGARQHGQPGLLPIVSRTLLKWVEEGKVPRASCLERARASGQSSRCSPCENAYVRRLPSYGNSGDRSAGSNMRGIKKRSVLMLFSRRPKPVPRTIDATFDGASVERIQFAGSGQGFKVTIRQDGKINYWWVPNDLANRHCDFIRRWMADGGFPEDADQPVIRKFLGGERPVRPS